MQTVILTIAIIIYTILLDIVWIGMLAKNLYEQEIGSLIRKSGEQMSPNLLAAGLVYLAIALGIIYFVLPKAQGNLTQALVSGAIFGMVTYGIYDFTNMAVLANWTWKISLIDVLWGTVLCATASLFATWVQRLISG